MTDNGSAYRAKTFAAACRRHGLKHLFTRPYTPRTNGKAERFIQTALREWSYATAYPTSAARTAALPPWLHHYNWHRPHTSLAGHAPSPVSAWQTTTSCDSTANAVVQFCVAAPWP
jgi:transposase InsO family protein